MSGSLSLRGLHAAGPCDVAHVQDTDGKIVLATAGADGFLRFWPADLKGAALAEHERGAPIRRLVAHPLGGAVFAAEDNYVRLLSAPSGEEIRTLARFTLPARALAPSPTGSALVAAGDEEGAKVLLLDEGDGDGAGAGASGAWLRPTPTPPRTTRTLPTGAYARGLAISPCGTLVAAAHADGSGSVWGLADGAKVGSLPRGTLARSDPTAPDARRREPAWHPRSDAVAFAGPAGDIVLLQKADGWATASAVARPDGSPSGEAGGSAGHGDAIAVTALAFSPNGSYLAVGRENGRLEILAMGGPGAREKAEPVTHRHLASSLLGLTWHPETGALVVATEDGEFGALASPVGPDRLQPHRPAAEDVAEGKGVRGRARDVEASEGSPAGSEGEGDSLASGGRSLSSDSEQGGGRSLTDSDASDGGESELGGRGGRRGARSRPPGRPTQGPIAPGSTPEDAAGARFLCWNRAGLVTRREVGPGRAVIEAEYHDTSGRSRRPPLVTDVGGITLGTLGEGGLLLATPGQGGGAEGWESGGNAASLDRRRLKAALDRPEGERSVVTWTPLSDLGAAGWSAPLPRPERAVGLAVGAGFLAIATSERRLHLLTYAGWPIDTLDLAGDVVAIVAEGARLGVVWGSPAAREMGGRRASAAVPCCDPSSLRCALFDLADPSLPPRALLPDSPVPLGPSATLEWLGLTPEGALATADSRGVVRVCAHADARGPAAAWRTVVAARGVAGPAAAGADGPAADPAGLAGGEDPCHGVGPAGAFAEVYRVVEVSCAGAVALVGSGARSQPPVPRPGGARPVLERLEARPCALGVSGAGAASEAGFLAARAGLAAEAGGRGAVDRAALRALAVLLQTDRVGAACDAVATLSTTAALNGARRLAAHHRSQPVVERVDETARERELASAREADEAAAAAARPASADAAPGPRATPGSTELDPAPPPPAAPPLGRAAGAENAGLANARPDPGAAPPKRKPAPNPFARLPKAGRTA